ncbi:MAG: replication protein [Bermanella sp.]
MGAVIDIESGDRVKVKTKDGYFQLANGIMDALCSVDLNGRQFRLVHAVIRFTYGWKAQSLMAFDRKHLAAVAGLKVDEVSRIKNMLVKSNILIEEGKEIGINPYISDWQSPQKRKNKTVHSHSKTVHSHSKAVQMHRSEENDNCASAQEELCILTGKTVHSHEIGTLPSLPLKTIKKSIKEKSEHASPDSGESKIIIHSDSVVQSKNGKKWGTQEDLDSAKFIFDSVSGRTMDTNEPNWPTWANELRLMREADNRQPSHIATLFKFADSHEFWSTVILSPSSLRKHWGKLAAQYSEAKHTRTDTRSIEERIKDTSWAEGL